ncbi:MAG: hypothetical protein NT094_05015, partial [Candidatus Staskawiczbacteria bacterium]|nr:hypothetical protein [Candidatus Staskawiczbacteria bacterium]
QWVNNSYIIFTEGDLPAQAGKIIISEIDYRGNINTVTLPQTITLPSDPNITINIKNPEIYFNQQEGKIYLMTNNTLLSSDKITP